MERAKRPAVGVGVIVLKGRQVLMGKRIGAHGEGTWQFPGGHLEFGEDPADCARREVLEETGLTIANPRPGPYTNDVFDREAKHYVTLFVVADWAGGEPQVREPERCLEWRWCDWDAMPEPRFLPVVHLLEQGYRPWSEGTG